MIHQPVHCNLADSGEFKIKVLSWLKQFNIFCFLDNCGYSSPVGFRCFIAAGAQRLIQPENFSVLHQQLLPNTWWFGHLNFEFSSGISSAKPEYTGFPTACFFEPEILIELNGSTAIVHHGTDDAEALIASILQTPVEEDPWHPATGFQQAISREDYLQQVREVLKHIQRGDCYELNFCQAFTAHTSVHPVQLFKQLMQASPNPFAALYRLADAWCLCASPERFLLKQQQLLCSEPIKGTAPRAHTPKEDQAQADALFHSQKDRSENVMVVDLVRNDLSRVCVAGSVKVPALYEIRTFPGVHQMVSTVCGTVKPDVSTAQILEATFPMGSMTGAPKHRVLELTRQYEAQQRGLFSGCIGYCTPHGDFDFNVVIRSMFLQPQNGTVAFLAGGGITHNSVPEQEYEESILKTRAIRNILGLPVE